MVTQLKIALDSAVIMYAINSESLLHLHATKLIADSPIKGYELHVSELLYLEVLSFPQIKDEEAREIRDGVAKNVSFNWPIDDEIILKAAQLRRMYHLKTPDAIHIATAFARKCDYFVTNDHTLINKKIIDGVAIESLTTIQAMIA